MSLGNARRGALVLVAAVLFLVCLLFTTTAPDEHHNPLPRLSNVPAADATAEDALLPSSFAETAPVEGPGHSSSTMTEASSREPPIAFHPTTWRKHKEGSGTICFGGLQAWMPCEDRPRCEIKRKMQFPCRGVVFYDNDVWDFCNPRARLNKSVYVMNPPLHVVNASVSDADVWRTMPMSLRDAWQHVVYPSLRTSTADGSTGADDNNRAADGHPTEDATRHHHASPSVAVGTASTVEATRRRIAVADAAYGVEADRAACSPESRRAVVGFAAKWMRPFQVMALVLSAYRAMGRPEACTRMHLFVSDPDHPLFLHLRARTTWGFTGDPMSMGPSELAAANERKAFHDSFLVVERFGAFERTIRGSAGNNQRVEVLRINVARWWIRHGRGRRYHQFIFVDTRDAVFMDDVFAAVNRTLRQPLSQLKRTTVDAEGSDLLQEYVYAASEEFPFFRQPRLGLQWNVEVHATTYGAEMMMLMQQLHLDDYPHMRLVNSGIYGGTYTALLDLFEIWGASTAAVFTETFGVDQPLLGGLFYFGLRLTHYPHNVLLLSGSDGPLRHLYTDGGTDPVYPYMRLLLGGGKRMWSSDFFNLVGDINTTDAALRASIEGDDAAAPMPRHLNCLGETYAIVHQADRYPAMWRWLTEPIAEQTVQWAKAHGVEFTWGPRKPKKKKGSKI